MRKFRTVALVMICLFHSAKGYGEVILKKCEIPFPRVEEDSCEGENCGRVAKIAQREFDVFEKADPKSKKIFTLKKARF